MRKHGGTPSRRDKHVTLAAISPPGVARGRFVGGQQSGLAGSKPPPLFTREASSCSSQGRRQGEPWGASPRPSAPTYLPPHASWNGRDMVPPALHKNATTSLPQLVLPAIIFHLALGHPNNFHTGTPLSCYFTPLVLHGVHTAHHPALAPSNSMLTTYGTALTYLHITYLSYYAQDASTWPPQHTMPLPQLPATTVGAQ